MPLGLASICREENWKKRTETKKVNSFSSNTEPTSVLHMRRSPTPSPPTSASTLSSSAAADKKDEWANELQPILAAAGAGRCGPGLEDLEAMWPDPISYFATATATATAGGAVAVEPVHEQSLLRWLAGGDIDEASLFGLKQLLQSQNNTSTNLGFAANAGLGILDQSSVLDPIGNMVSCSGSVFPVSGFNGNAKMDQISASVDTTADSSFLGSNFNNLGGSITPSSNMNLILQSQPQLNHQFVEEKPQIVNSQQQLPVMNQSPNFPMLLPYNHQEHHDVFQPPLKRHNSIGSNNHFGIGIGVGTNVQVLPQQHFQLETEKQKALLGRGDPEMVQQQHQQQNLLEELYKAAELVGTGNFSHAQGILARLNHQLSPVGTKPLNRAAYYFKEALQLLLFVSNNHNNQSNVSSLPRTLTPFDVIFKMGAYKVFSEISPFVQFVNFTSNQTFLEAVDDSERIHIVDFDIGIGAQWASFLQELPLRSKGAPALRITAFASPSMHQPIELALMRDNLTQFANEVGVSLELEVVNFDYLEQHAVYNLASFSLRPDESEVVLVNLPIWCYSSDQSHTQLPAVIRFTKQLSPRIVVCLDRGCNRSDLPFPQHVLHALHSNVNLMESLDAAGVNSDAVNKIERFLLQPGIESTVLGRLRGPGKMPQWKTLLASAGFSPVPFSNFTETQADCLVKRAQVRGYHVDKRQASLVLCWQRRELVSASAWRC